MYDVATAVLIDAPRCNEFRECDQCITAIRTRHHACCAGWASHLHVAQYRLHHDSRFNTNSQFSPITVLSLQCPRKDLLCSRPILSMALPLICCQSHHPHPRNSAMMFPIATLWLQLLGARRACNSVMIAAMMMSTPAVLRLRLRELRLPLLLIAIGS